MTRNAAVDARASDIRSRSPPGRRTSPSSGTCSARSPRRSAAGGRADDMRLAVTEACTNVVRHAYADGDGTIDVVVAPERRARWRWSSPTRAAGWARAPTPRGPGLGLPLIAALADSLEIERDASAGSRLVMSFRARRAGHDGAA